LTGQEGTSSSLLSNVFVQTFGSQSFFTNGMRTDAVGLDVEDATRVVIEDCEFCYNSRAGLRTLIPGGPTDVRTTSNKDPAIARQTSVPYYVICDFRHLELGDCWETVGSMIIEQPLHRDERISSNITHLIVPCQWMKHRERERQARSGLKRADYQ
jgi:hypothetical protein